MAIIRPCAELRNNYNEISRICHETKEPVYITKNGTNDLVILSNEAYEKSEDIKITNKVEEIFNKKYSDFEAFKNEIYEKINTGLKQIEEGKYVSAKQAFKELEEKYELWKNIRKLIVNKFIIIYKVDNINEKGYILHIFSEKQDYYNLL